MLTTLKDEYSKILRILDEIKNELSLISKQSKDSWLDNEEAMRYLKVSRRTLQNYRDKNMLPYSMVGNKIYYKIQDIEDTIEEKIEDIASVDECHPAQVVPSPRRLHLGGVKTPVRLPRQPVVPDFVCRVQNRVEDGTFIGGDKFCHVAAAIVWQVFKRPGRCPGLTGQ